MAKTNLSLRTPKEGERISESGFYKISNEVYHSDCANAPSVSSSSLVTINSDPRKYWSQSIYNPERIEPKATSHFNFGHAAHHMVLDGDLPENEYAVRPARMKSWNSQDAKHWKQFQEAEGMKVLTPDDLDNLEGMANAIATHPEAKEVFRQGLVEASMFVKKGKVFIKTRPDIIPLANAAMIQDYKTTTSASRTALQYEIKKWEYDSKLANVYWTLKQLLPDVVPTFDQAAADISFSLIFQEKKAPWSINIIPIAKGQILLRLAQNLAAMQIFEDNIFHGNDFPHMPVNYDNRYELRPYEQDKLKELIDAGIWPTVDPSTLMPSEPK